MEQGNSTRRRAVRLTPEALDALQTALFRAWSDAGEGSKLTRERKAELLGVSIVTAERVLHGKGVDRTTLVFVFKNLGLPWEDSNCQQDFVPLKKAGTEVGRSTEVPKISTPKRKYPGRPVSLFGLSFVALGAAFLASGRMSFEDCPDWTVQYGTLFAAGCDAYNRGDYSTARHDFDGAAKLARKYEGLGYLADSYRMQGELASAQGDFAEAVTKYQEALDLRILLSKQSKDARLHIYSLQEVMGDAELSLGRLSAAKDHFSQSLYGFSSMNDKGGIASSYRGLGTVAAKQGNPEEAHGLFRKGLDALKGQESADMAFDIRARDATLLLKSRGHEAAIRELQTCLDHWNSQQHPRWIATTKRQLASVYAAYGESHQALDLLVQSRSLFTSVGDKAGADDCTKQLQRLGCN